MSYKQNKRRYAELINGFLDGSIAVNEFEQWYTSLWRADRDEEWNLKNNSGKPIMTVLREFTDGQITQEEFDKRWLELVWINDEQERQLHNILDQIFSALDVYADPPELDYEMSEEQLKESIRDLGQQLNALN